MTTGPATAQSETRDGGKEGRAYQDTNAGDTGGIEEDAPLSAPARLTHVPDFRVLRSSRGRKGVSTFVVDGSPKGITYTRKPNTRRRTV